MEDMIYGNSFITYIIFTDTPVGENNPSVGSPSSDDMFSSFLSAPPTASPAQSLRRTPEEESFFNQPSNSPAGGERNKLTTDSILALYGKSQPTQPVVNSSYQVPIPGMYAYISLVIILLI